MPSATRTPAALHSNARNRPERSVGTFVGIRIHRIEKLFLDQPLVSQYGSLSPARFIFINQYVTEFKRQSSVFRAIPDSQLFSVAVPHVAVGIFVGIRIQ